MRIGELAQLTGVGIQTIRFYEQQGLLALPNRQGNGYRTYAENQVERLLFIRHCRMLGLSLEAIRTLQEFQDDPHRSCAAINAMLDKHIAGVQSQIIALQNLEMQLVALRAYCDNEREVADCGILSGIRESVE